MVGQVSELESGVEPELGSGLPVEPESKLESRAAKTDKAARADGAAKREKTEGKLQMASVTPQQFALFAQPMELADCAITAAALDAGRWDDVDRPLHAPLPRVEIGSGGNAPRTVPTGSANPHLLAARRLARRMRKLTDHSWEETQAGLAICRQLKAYLQDPPTGHEAR